MAPALLGFSVSKLQSLLSGGTAHRHSNRKDPVHSSSRLTHRGVVNENPTLLNVTNHSKTPIRFFSSANRKRTNNIKTKDSANQPRCTSSDRNTFAECRHLSSERHSKQHIRSSEFYPNQQKYSPNAYPPPSAPASHRRIRNRSGTSWPSLENGRENHSQLLSPSSDLIYTQTESVGEASVTKTNQDCSQLRPSGERNSTRSFNQLSCQNDSIPLNDQMVNPQQDKCPRFRQVSQCFSAQYNNSIVKSDIEPYDCYTNGETNGGLKQLPTTQITNQQLKLELPSLQFIQSSNDSITMADLKVHTSLRLGEVGITTNAFWQRLYDREMQLVIHQQFDHLLIPASYNEKMSSWSSSTLDSLVPLFETLPPNDVLISAQFTYPGTSITPEARESVVHWMNKVVKNMKWKRSTFYVAVHAMDCYIVSYCSSLYKRYSSPEECEITNEQEKQLPQVIKKSRSPDSSKTKSIQAQWSHPPKPLNHLTSSKQSSNEEISSNDNNLQDHLEPSTSAIEGDLPVLSTAALFLGVATEEEHNQAHRAKLFVHEVPNVDSIKQIFTKQLDILTCLNEGLLITKTPEDFLYYYLANMKMSSNPSYAAAYAQLIAPTESSNTILHGESPTNYLNHVNHIKQINFQNMNTTTNNLTITTMRLDTLIDWTLTITTLVYEKGGYVYLPASRLTAACLVPILAVTVLPDLSLGRYSLSQFSMEVFHFERPEILEIILIYVLPMLCEYLSISIHCNNNGNETSCAELLTDLLSIYSTFRIPLYHYASTQHLKLVSPSSSLSTASPKSIDTQINDAEDTSTTVSGASSLSSSSGSRSTISVLSSVRNTSKRSLGGSLGNYYQKYQHRHMSQDHGLLGTSSFIYCCATTSPYTRNRNNKKYPSQKTYKNEEMRDTRQQHGINSLGYLNSSLTNRSRFRSRRFRLTTHPQRAQRLHDLIHRLDHDHSQASNIAFEASTSTSFCHPSTCCPHFQPSEHPNLRQQIPTNVN